MTERERPGVLLIHRPSNMRAHPGQIAFPGGKLDPGETPVEAALREAWEELGIRDQDVRVVGASDQYLTGSGFDITPVIGVVPPDIEINPNPTEVAQWFEAPLDFVLDPANQKQHWIEFEGAMHRYSGHPVGGAQYLGRDGSDPGRSLPQAALAWLKARPSSACRRPPGLGARTWPG